MNYFFVVFFAWLKMSGGFFSFYLYVKDFFESNEDKFYYPCQICNALPLYLGLDETIWMNENEWLDVVNLINEKGYKTDIEGLKKWILNDPCFEFLDL